MTGTKKSAPAKRPKARTAASAAAAATPLVTPGVRPVVFLDANILIPEYLRSIFLELSEAGLLQANWSEGVLVETRRNLIDPERRFGLDAVRVDRMLKLMRNHFPQALVLGSESLVPQFVGRTDPRTNTSLLAHSNAARRCTAGSPWCW